MRKYFLGVFLGMISIPMTMFFLPKYFKHAQLEEGRWVKEIINKKSLIASKKTEPRLIFLSGSNTLFGYSTKYIEEKYQIPSVNFGLNAGLGRSYLLALGKSILKKGDLLILSLEYELYEQEHYYPALRYQVLTEDTWFFQKLSLKNKIEFLSSLTALDWLKLTKASLLYPDAKKSGGMEASTLNEWGDETNNKNTHNIAYSVLKSRKKYFIDNKLKAELRDFNKHVEYIGAKCIIIFPSIMRGGFNEKINVAFINEIKKAATYAHIEIIGKPADYFFDEKDRFEDSTYHRNNFGQLSATHTLINKLKSSNLKYALNEIKHVT